MPVWGGGGGYSGFYLVLFPARFLTAVLKGSPPRVSSSSSVETKPAAEGRVECLGV